MEVENQPPLDGANVFPLLNGERERRESAIGFQSPVPRENSLSNPDYLQMAWCDDDYKLLSLKNGESWELYALGKDPGEEKDLSSQQPDRAARMKVSPEQWQMSCRRSAAGQDY